VQEHDTALHRLAHKRSHLPELPQLREVRDKEAAARDELEVARFAEGEVRRELTRLEDEIGKVEARTQRDRERLDSGAGAARELVSLQQERETLARRRERLEDEALAAMERLDEARQVVAGLEEGLEQLGGRGAELDQAIAAATAAIDEAAGVEAAKRATAAEGLDAALMKLYERLRERLGGVGAAALVRGRCEGCGMELSASDLGAVLGAGADEVARCEECTRILVRGEDAGR
jgi:predicted  nucleic acid-binding Zn-ribbon protein